MEKVLQPWTQFPGNQDVNGKLNIPTAKSKNFDNVHVTLFKTSEIIHNSTYNKVRMVTG